MAGRSVLLAMPKDPIVNERNSLLNSIADSIADYRISDLDPPCPEHVDRWVCQFEHDCHMPILSEMDHVLNRTYFSRTKIIEILNKLLTSKKVAGDDPCEFWKNVTFLDIQKCGASQTEMVALFDSLLQSKWGFSISEREGSTNTFIYLDDAIFSGGRVFRDLSDWAVNQAPEEAELHIIVIALHRSAYFNRDRLENAITKSGKRITVSWWRKVILEDRKAHADSSDVLRPTSIPTEPAVQAYIESLNYRPHLRNPGQVGTLGIFSSDTMRQLLEQELLKAGVRIRELCPGLNRYQRPLGNMVLETLGFGSMIVTFRNCPNNAPLALWAGDPWYPLFPRVTNSDTSIENFKAMLKEIEV